MGRAEGWAGASHVSPSGAQTTPCPSFARSDSIANSLEGKHAQTQPHGVLRARAGQKWSREGVSPASPQKVKPPRTRAALPNHPSESAPSVPRESKNFAAPSGPGVRAV